MTWSTQMQFDKQLERANRILGLLRDGAGYNAALVGGALRVQALGGTTNDFDIAIIVADRDEAEALNKDVCQIVLPKLGWQFLLQHFSSEYEDAQNGFVADWRFEDINIIAYSEDKVSDHTDLINKFDLNINQWYLDDEGVLQNDHYDPVTKLVKLNPYRDGLGHISRLTDRIQRFQKLYPELDWSEIEARKTTFFGEVQYV